MATLIDGKALAAKIRSEISAEVQTLRQTRGVIPGLAVIRVGEDPASKIYVASKNKAAQDVGFQSWEYVFPETVSQAELMNHVQTLNERSDVHGVLVQLPLPSSLDTNAVLLAVHPQKDVDGLHPVNAGNLSLGRPGIRPCTPLGCMRLIHETGVVPAGKHAVIVGRGNLVGKPLALLLLEANATVTVCHRHSALAEEVPRADILVAAAGSPELVRGSWVKPGAVVIDVGQSRNAAGKLVGDVEFVRASERAAFITPVPGGVGPMTVAMLLHNTLEAAKRAHER